MVKLMKRGDTYRPEKLAASVRKAGASEETAKKVVASVKVREGMSTLELREQVTGLLQKLDPKAAKTYISYKKR